MKIIAVVPIKLNSKRLPLKNIRRFTNGKPLCFYILSTLLQIPQINQIFVYCSNPIIKQYLPTGIQYLQRPKSLDQDSTSINEVLKSFSKEIDADIYLMTHATAPFISKDSILKGLSAVSKGIYDSSFAAKKLQDFLWVDGKPFNYSLENIPRTQDLQPIFEETSGFYIYRKSVISNLNRRIGNKPFIVEVSEIEGIDIDELEDFDLADAVYNYRRCKKEIL